MTEEKTIYGRRLKGYYSIKEVAEKLTTTKQAIHYLIQNKQLIPEYVDTFYLISEKELNRFIESRQAVTDNRFKIR
jgi:predicted DNA-binding protein YlxM (UPF0122 family)